MNYKLPDDLTRLIAYLRKLPGVGAKTAERFAFDMLLWDVNELESLGEALETLKEKVFPCATCGCLTNQGLCLFCKDRDPSSLCLLASPRDVFAIEETGQYKGLYHVIEHLLSPLDGRFTETLRLDRIAKRIEENGVRELILAFDSTIEGDTTALYLQNHLSHLPLKFSRLAFGIPVGSSLEYIDGGTLARAFSGRQFL